jgi:hypothetical protein
MTHIHDNRIAMVVRFVDVGKRLTRKTLGGRRIQRAPATLKGGRLHHRLYDRVYTRMHLHCMALWISDCHSSNDLASIIGGALQRILQLLRNEINHRIPSCTAVVWEEEHTPNHKAATACIYSDQALRLVLTPGRNIAPSRLLTSLREGADVRKFAAPSDDFHHSACLSSVRACGVGRRRPRSCGRPSWPCCYSDVSLSRACSLVQTYPASPRLSSNQTVTQIV